MLRSISGMLYMYENVHDGWGVQMSSVCQKGQKGFLLVEFRKGSLLARLRFKIVLASSGYRIEIRETRTKKGKLRANRIAVGDRISERRLFEAMTEYISNKEKIPLASIACRWENGSLGLRRSEKSEVSTF
ncbi:MAG: hypothetical protein NWE99_01255 [Candidatus Bathyarchaeota archaeon]|nr:hypothetical protein [Candidatus Bathyarchaeota archaeon]